LAEIHTIDLYFAACRITVRSQVATVIEWLRRDFPCHLTPLEANRIDVVIESTLDVHGPRPRGRKFLRHLGGTAFGWGDHRLIDYQGAYVVYDHRRGLGTVASADVELLYHYSYYLIIAVSGEQLDAQGFHRFHAVGVSYRGIAFLVSMPPKGGKSTLAMSLLDDPEFLLISEDTPLIDLRGRVNPFPIRISLREIRDRHIPARFVREKRDPVFGRKLLLDLEFHGTNRVHDTPVSQPVICWGRRSTTDTPAILPLSPLRSLALVLVQVVTGKDCPQRAEIVLRFTPWGLCRWVTIAASRLAAAVALWRHGRFYELVLSQNPPKNAAFVTAFLRSLTPPEPKLG
jgi:hypothetical protein